MELHACARLAVLTLAVGLVGCQTSRAPSRELKREADRNVILLNRARADLQAAQVEADQAKAEAKAAAERSGAAAQDAAELRQRLSRADAELMAARQRIRQLEEAALAAGITVPPSSPR